mmetsp:Transcript_45797/g.143549  ORF Transcript_45797/g.143549 Transcript_45797/m.143549 type:complete len:334 (+) Transcript_45797:654-1655(+)
MRHVQAPVLSGDVQWREAVVPRYILVGTRGDEDVQQANLPRGCSQVVCRGAATHRPVARLLLHQKLHHLRLAGGHAQVQRQLSVLHFHLPVSAVLHEELGNLHMPHESRDVQGRVAVLHGRTQVSPGLNQVPQHLHVARRRCDVQGCLAIFRGALDVCFQLGNEHFCGLNMVVLSRQVQRSPALVHLILKANAHSGEQLYGLRLAVARGEMERCLVLVRDEVHIDPLAPEEVQSAHLPLLCRHVQCGVAALHDDINLRMAGVEQLQDVHVALLCRDVHGCPPLGIGKVGICGEKQGLLHSLDVPGTRAFEQTVTRRVIKLEAFHVETDGDLHV